MKKQRIFIIIFVLSILLIISAICTLDPKLNLQPTEPYCCTIYDSESGDLLGCLGGKTQEECNDVFEEGYNVNFYNKYCEDVKDSNDVSICSYEDNDCFSYTDHLLYYGKKGAKICYENSVYLCEYNNTEKKVMFNLIQDCEEYYDCVKGECILPPEPEEEVEEENESNYTNPYSEDTVSTEAGQKKVNTSFESCNNNGVCETEFENKQSCPGDCIQESETIFVDTKERFNYLLYVIPLSIILIIIIVLTITRFKKNGRFKLLNEKPKKK